MPTIGVRSMFVGSVGRITSNLRRGFGRSVLDRGTGSGLTTRTSIRTPVLRTSRPLDTLKAAPGAARQPATHGGAGDRVGVSELADQQHYIVP